MGFCSKCGRAIDGSPAACPSCGAPYAAPAAYDPSSSAPAYGPGGPAGKVRPPAIVLILILVTLGIYGLFYWWSVSREVDDYTGRPGYAHRKVRLGIFLSLGALVLLVIGFVLLGSALSFSEGAEPQAEVDAGAAGGFMLAMMAGGAAAVAGAILLLMGQWRVWTTIRDDEVRRGIQNPLSPGLQLFFVLMPYVNLVTMWIAYYRTQKGLNGMWERTGPATPAPYA